MHAPSTQKSKAPPGQTWPHDPQFAWSLHRLAHDAPQQSDTVPGGPPLHPPEQPPPAVHVPKTHEPPAPHDSPHMLQLSESQLVSTQPEPGQQVRPTPHDAPPSHEQVPPVQPSFGGQLGQVGVASMGGFVGGASITDIVGASVPGTACASMAPGAPSGAPGTSGRTPFTSKLHAAASATRTEMHHRDVMTRTEVSAAPEKCL